MAGGAIHEIGLSPGGDFPKRLTDDVVRAADVVITMGCGDTRRIYPGKKYEDWNSRSATTLLTTGGRTRTPGHVLVDSRASVRLLNTRVRAVFYAV